MGTKKKSDKGEKSLQSRSAASMMSPWDEMEHWFNEFGRRGWFSLDWPRTMGSLAPFEGRTPRVDMIDRDKEIVIRAELPGVKKDDLDVTVSEHSVTISAHTTREEKEEKEDYYRREMSRGDFQRTLSLPDSVDESKSKAKFADGILELTLPKMEKTERKKVKID